MSESSSEDLLKAVSGRDTAANQPPDSPIESEPDLTEDGLRAQRRNLILEYEAEYHCRFVAFVGPIRSFAAISLEAILQRIQPQRDLHLLLSTLGGDGEAAIRLLRQLQSRCRNLTVVVPHQAKSAGTILVLGAHSIVTGPTSDLGPIDPQIWLKHYGRMPAKAVVEAFEHAERECKTHGQLAEFHALTLANRSAIDAQDARDALGHTAVQLRQALAGNPDRTPFDVEDLAQHLDPLLVREPQSHAASISAQELKAAGLPVSNLAAKAAHWLRIWELWIQYLEVPENQIFESAELSFTFHLDPSS